MKTSEQQNKQWDAITPVETMFYVKVRNIVYLPYQQVGVKPCEINEKDSDWIILVTFVSAEIQPASLPDIHSTQKRTCNTEAHKRAAHWVFQQIFCLHALMLGLYPRFKILTKIW